MAIFILIPISHLRNLNTEKLNNLPKVMQLVKHGAGVQKQADWPHVFNFYATLSYSFF